MPGKVAGLFFACNLWGLRSNFFPLAIFYSVLYMVEYAVLYRDVPIEGRHLDVIKYRAANFARLK